MKKGKIWNVVLEVIRVIIAAIAGGGAGAMM